ncbi:hypothetical protein AMTR_s00065p00037640 [Amborella trichopoda]|uniref:SWIM-type domain-containing protein n=2 Tax=Amborella trichopoda TaxID=13333 RepID=U5DAR9_AMBTC|nr:hypothetical protein AMTR_s00065p00037640 [Amborella trichopoda]
MQHRILAVGQQFPDAKSCRRAIKEAAIAEGFDFRSVKNDRVRFTARCAKEGCPWRLHAAKLPDSTIFTIKSIREAHTCGGTITTNRQVSGEWVASYIEERLKENPHCKPKEILQDIQKQHGFTISYKKAWRGYQRCMTAIYGSFEDGYRLLPAYCEQIKLTNPDSIARVVSTGAEHRFRRLFLSYQASIYGFVNGCRPLLGLDVVHLHGKYLGSLLSATAFDADGAIFPLAFGVVDVETEENWMWFLSELHKLIEMNARKMPMLTILFERRKGVVEGVQKKFPSAFHGYCIRHLCEEFRLKFKNPRLVHLLWKSAHTLSTIEFKAKMAEMQELSSEAYEWIQEIPARHWAEIYFEGARYGRLTSNVVEMNEWIHEARELPIIQMMEWIHRKLMAEFEERRQKGAQWTTVLAPSAEKQMAESHLLAQNYRVIRSSEVEFEILFAEQTNIVNIDTVSCSCRAWQLYGLPCSHATASLVSCNKSVYQFTDKCFTVANYRDTYSQAVNPLPDKGEWEKLAEGGEDGNSKASISVRPPKVRRPPGRPKMKQVCTEDLYRQKHTVHCRRCNQTGHYKTTCRAVKALPDPNGPVMALPDTNMPAAQPQQAL